MTQSLFQLYVHPIFSTKYREPRRNMKSYACIVLFFFGLRCALVRGQEPQQSPQPLVRMVPLSFSKACGDCEGGPCVTADIEYPKVVLAEYPQAADRINAAIANWMLQLDNGKIAKTPQEFLEQFVKRLCQGVQADAKKSPESFGGPWYETRTVRAEWISARVLCLSLVASGYFGGAHGTDSIGCQNFRVATGRSIKLSDIFKLGFEEPLNAIGERLLPGAGYTLQEGHFQLNDNFCIGPNGLTFHFQSHEITSSNEDVTLLLPYSDLRDLLRPDADIP
jgi:hypothetical protein